MTSMPSRAPQDEPDEAETITAALAALTSCARTLEELARSMPDHGRLFALGLRKITEATTAAENLSARAIRVEMYLEEGRREGRAERASARSRLRPVP